ncbi:hypothetical protein ACFSTH_11855 [Paenibacillus yanchengensis]|uniref:Uncharacterized protein n=1 Tax=Paenibacillus yanchengensis TaxID=2035833 RepID=A0ABW4YJA4_9BACL
MFSVKDGAELLFDETLISEANEWCMYNGSNCESIHRANHHLMFLGVSELFDPGENVVYVSRTIEFEEN